MSPPTNKKPYESAKSPADVGVWKPNLPDRYLRNPSILFPIANTKSRPVDSRVCFLYARFIYKTKRLIAPQHNRLIPDMLRHLHIVLPDMAQHGFLALGVFGAYPPGGIGFAKILPALVFPVALPFCGEIHHYTAFSPHLREKGHRKVTFFDRLQVISYILDKLHFYFAAIGLGGQREWFWYGFCVGLAGGRVRYVDR